MPGLDGTGLLFNPFIEALDRRIETQVVTYPVDRALGYAELEALVRSALPKTGSYVVLGESFSGPIAIRIAADPPAGLVGVMLCVTFAKNPLPLLAWMRPWAMYLPVRRLLNWVRAPFMWGGSPKQSEPLEVQRATSIVHEAVLRYRIAAVLSVDETNALAQIRLPALVLRASYDNVVPQRASNYILQVPSSAELMEIDGPHLLLLARPRECAAVVIRFLEGL